MSGSTKLSILPKIAAGATYLACGLMVAQYASVLPFAKERPGLAEMDFGMVMLAFAVGALVCLPLAAYSSNRWGCRWPLTVGCVGAVPALLLMALSADPVLFTLGLFLFGGAVGTFDVIMNLIGGIAERRYHSTLQPLFHGLYNIGGVLGSLGVSMLLKCGLGISMIITGAVVFLAALFAVCSVFWPGREANGPAPQAGAERKKVRPTGALLLVAAMACAFYIAEGVVQDWGAIFLREDRGLAPEYAVLAFGAFMAAMATMRLVGGKAADVFGLRVVLLVSGVVTSCAMLGLWIIPNPWICLGLFVVTAIGLANVIPLLFSQAARTEGMPVAVAVSTVTTVGYAGVLVGPKLLGMASKTTGLPAIFLAAGVLACIATAVIFLKKDFCR